MKPQPEPTRLRLAVEFDDLQEDKAGWTFNLWVQLYNIVNDRLWIFRNGSFRKSNLERVPKNRVKIHDGHNREQKASDNIGRILSAKEFPRGNRCKAFLTKSAQSIAEKLNDRTVDDASVEVTPVKARRTEVELEKVPESARPWIEINTDGLAIVTEILEVIWWDVGLVGKSSQDTDAIIDSPIAVSFQDLPVSLCRWDPDGARRRVAEWAGEGVAKLSRAHLVMLPGGECIGQVADVVDGQLVAVADALAGAYGAVADSLGTRLADRELEVALAATSRLLDRYDAKRNDREPATTSRLAESNPATPVPGRYGDEPAPTDVSRLEDHPGHHPVETNPLTPDPVDGTSLSAESLDSATAQTGGAEQPAVTPEIEEPTDLSTHSDEGSESRLTSLAHRIKLQHLRRRARRSENDPASNGRGATAGRSPERTGDAP